MFDNFLTLDISGEVISSLVVMTIIMILVFVIGYKARRQNPLEKPKGLLLIVEIGVKFFDDLSRDLIGTALPNFGGFIMGIAVYLFSTFIFGLIGFPSPTCSMAIPLSLGLTSFLAIHITSARFTKWSYFKRYIEPIPVLLPINLISMWAPLLSMTMRLFGNAIAGWTLLTIIELALRDLSAAIFKFMPTDGTGILAGNWNEMFLFPIPKAILSVYFDLFSGLIQTFVFILLTTIFVGQEVPEDYGISTLERRTA
ncbi:MAG TPA: F0F1 ATP synthase subunit A [Erysipelotrichaceae bacterium]|nr:F0F1 ATP synthase subunit A [Erysipelotrichaceae bacterium]